MRGRPALVLPLLLATAAQAGLTAAELDRVVVAPPPGARLQLDLGRPAVLVFADVDCDTLCDAIVAQTAATLEDSGLAPGEDYTLVLVSLDPFDDAQSAADFVAAQIPPALLPATLLLRPDAPELQRITEALGYGYAFDAEADRFAHPAARFVLAADGRLSQVIPAFAATAAEMRAAIVGARPATGVIERLALLCYGFDPVTGRYSLAIGRVLTGGGVLTALLLGGGLALAFWREKRGTGT